MTETPPSAAQIIADRLRCGDRCDDRAGEIVAELIAAGLLADAEATEWGWRSEDRQVCPDDSDWCAGLGTFHLHNVRVRRAIGPWIEVPSDEH